MKRLFLALIILILLTVPALATVVLLNKVGTNPSHWSGLSTDVKPTTGSYGSTFYVQDTGIYYMYGGSGWVVDNRNLGDGGQK